MQNGRRTGRNHRPSKPQGSPDGRKRWESNSPRDTNGSQNARRNYERYLALAEAQIRAGDTIGAENSYQHAEHYFRSMSSDSGTT